MEFDEKASQDLKSRASAVRAILESALPGGVEAEFDGETKNGPSAEFRIPVRTPLDRRLTILLFEDSSHVIVGPCVAILELAGYADDPELFHQMTAQLVQDLLRGPLCVRIRKTLFGGRAGAFVLTDANGSRYKSGEGFAILFGKTQCYDDWLGSA